MGLDYDGIPKDFTRKRDLTLGKINKNSLTDFLDKQSDPTPLEDKIFDDLARTFLKGEALKDALGDMDPAGFIPVEDESTVVSSIQRIDPNANSFTIITFGLFKEACEFLAGRVSAINEEFIVNFNVKDPNLEATVVQKTHTSVNNSGDDWISQFLYGGAAVAGLMLAGYAVDVFGTNAPKTTFESNSSGNEPKLWSLQGMPVGVALLIELGINLVAVELLFQDSSSLDPQVMQQFQELDKDPKARQKILEDFGYDYVSLRQNRKFDDYKAIKQYALNYIARTPEKASYDHWVAWLQTLESQDLVKSGLSMAPTFSQRWAGFRDLGAEQATTNAEQTVESFGDNPENYIKASLNLSVKGYLSTILTLVNPAYNSMYSSFQFELDERTLCCILYFIGPLDTETLEKISQIMKLGTFHLSLNMKDLLTYLTEGILNMMLSMMTNYASELMSNVINKIFAALFSVPDSDITAMIKLCVGIDWIFAVFDMVLQSVVKLIQDLINNLNFAIMSIGKKISVGASIYTERRFLTTAIALVDAIVNKLDYVKDVCQFEPGEEDNLNIDNDRAAQAAVEFVVNELPRLFPRMQMSEELRRKHFSNLPGFETTNLHITVPPTDELGIPASSFAFRDPVADCGNDSRATQSIILGRKLAEAFKSVI